MALLYRMGTGNGSGSDIKPYTVNFECASGYIGQTLTMTYKGTPHAGETVDNVSGTVGSDGTLTLYPMHSGEWECSCYSSVTGTTMKKTIDLSYWGVQPTVTFEDTPNGATVTPTDDVKTWLHCANIWDKTYTTISEVITDSTTLNALIANENANNYLVRSTSFATDMCADETAMKYIGLNDYCANKLLADSTWLEAICNSDYFENVLNVKVPTLDDYIGSDGGEAICSDYYVPGNRYPWKAFDDKDATSWCNVGGATGYIGYKFPKKVRVNKLHLVSCSESMNELHTIKDFNIYGSDDGTNWGTPIYSGTKVSSVALSKQDFNINNNKSYLYYKVQAKNTHNGAYTTIGTVQFYGREEA